MSRGCRICHLAHRTSNCNHPLILQTHEQALVSFRSDFENPPRLPQLEWIYIIHTNQLYALALYVGLPISWNKIKTTNAVKAVYKTIISKQNQNLPYHIPTIVNEVKQSIRNAERNEINRQNQLQQLRQQRQQEEEPEPLLLPEPAPYLRRRNLTIDDLQTTPVPQNTPPLHTPEPTQVDSRYVTPRTEEREREAHRIYRTDTTEPINMPLFENISTRLRMLFPNNRFRFHVRHGSLVITPSPPKIPIIHKFQIQLTLGLKIEQHEEINECSICYESVVHRSCISNCNHNYCTPCMMLYLNHNKTKNSINCPNCRTNLSHFDLYCQQSMHLIKSLLV
jgi:hypothetical protein